MMKLFEMIKKMQEIAAMGGADWEVVDSSGCRVSDVSAGYPSYYDDDACVIIELRRVAWRRVV